jgi:hypothetical protein
MRYLDFHLDIENTVFGYNLVVNHAPGTLRPIIVAVGVSVTQHLTLPEKQEAPSWTCRA